MISLKKITDVFVKTNKRGANACEGSNACGGMNACQEDPACR
ncbi:MAG: hypothetical protein ACOCUI_02315 [bacterium]